MSDASCVFSGGAARFQSWDVQFLGPGSTALLQKIERYTQFGAVCYPPPKKLRKKLGVRPVFFFWGGGDPSTPSVVAPIAFSVFCRKPTYKKKNGKVVISKSVRFQDTSFMDESIENRFPFPCLP